MDLQFYVNVRLPDAPGIGADVWFYTGPGHALGRDRLISGTVVFAPDDEPELLLAGADVELCEWGFSRRSDWESRAGVWLAWLSIEEEPEDAGVRWRTDIADQLESKSRVFRISS